MMVDSNKFIELLKPNYNDIVRYCRALCSKYSPDDAADVLQQSLLQAIEKFESLNDETKFRSWLFTITTRVFYTQTKKSFWKKFLPLDNSLMEFPEIINRMEIYETKTLMNEALLRLSGKERAAILLFEIAEFSIKEIKQIQNEFSLSAVKSRLSRARKKLKKFILEAEKNDSIISNTTQSNNFEGIENETIKLTAEYRSGK